MMPSPPGRNSARRAGNGFQISKPRKSINPASKYFQFTSPRHQNRHENCVTTSWKGGTAPVEPKVNRIAREINCPESFVHHHNLRVFGIQVIRRRDWRPDKRCESNRDGYDNRWDNVRDRNVQRGRGHLPTE